jgi:hypothetical protein
VESLFLLSPLYGQNKQAEEIIPSSLVRKYVNRFNEADNELYVQLIPNSEAAKFLSENIPRFECPDRELEEIYYFRWWTFCKHIRQTPEGSDRLLPNGVIPDSRFHTKVTNVSGTARPGPLPLPSR